MHLRLTPLSNIGTDGGVLTLDRVRLQDSLVAGSLSDLLVELDSCSVRALHRSELGVSAAALVISARGCPVMRVDLRFGSVDFGVVGSLTCLNTLWVYIE